MYWQTSVHVIGAISLILFEFTYNIFPLAEAVCLLSKGVSMVKLDAKEIEISKKSEILLRISRLG
jgi:hypothetical protein